MTKVWSRKEAQEHIDLLLDEARATPQMVEEHDGRFVVRFEPGVKIPVSEWAVLQGTLENDDVL